MKALILEHLVLNFKYKNNYIITAVLGEIYKHFSIYAWKHSYFNY